MFKRFRGVLIDIVFCDSIIFNEKEDALIFWKAKCGAKNNDSCSSCAVPLSMTGNTDEVWDSKKNKSASNLISSNYRDCYCQEASEQFTQYFLWSQLILLIDAQPEADSGSVQPPVTVCEGQIRLPRSNLDYSNYASSTYRVRRN